MCFPSIAPMQLGKFHLSKKSLAISLNAFSVGLFMCIGCKTSQIAFTVSRTIADTVVAPIRNVKLRPLNDAPVAKYLQK